jgi:hypothetical protein
LLKNNLTLPTYGVQWASIYLKRRIDMFTAKDFQEQLDLKASTLEGEVDNWLKNEVLPRYSGKDHGEEVPEWITSVQLISYLKRRGFSVIPYSGYRGGFVYITIPPQGE